LSGSNAVRIAHDRADFRRAIRAPLSWATPSPSGQLQYEASADLVGILIAAAAGAAMSAMIDAIVATRMGRSPSVQGDKASAACGAASILRASCPTPGNSTSRQLNGQPRVCARVFAALNTLAPR